MINDNLGYWNRIFDDLSARPAGEVLRLRKHLTVHPESAGARQSLGLPVGQHSDFRWAAGDCRGLHVRDFGSHYEAHIDKVDPSCDLVEHLRNDAPGAYITSAAAIGAIVGAMLGSRDAVLAGAVIGAAVGAITLDEKS